MGLFGRTPSKDPKEQVTTQRRGSDFFGNDVIPVGLILLDLSPSVHCAL